LGNIAQRFPALIQEIADEGHEIGSHGNNHQLLTSMTEHTFREEIRSSKHLLEDVTGQAVVQFRAPSWSLNNSNYEWLSILEEEGYTIDSSIQPFWTPFGGLTTAPLVPFKPIIKGKQLSLIEFPSTVWNMGALRFPFAGGFYLRALPLKAVQMLLQAVNRKRPGMIYIHPWEMDPAQPIITRSLWIRFIQYYGLNTTAKKLDWLLEHGECHPLAYIVEILSREAKIENKQLK